MIAAITTREITRGTISVLLTHMNYVLDFNESTEYVAVIEDKGVAHLSKGETDYRLQLTVNEKSVKIDVSSDTYDRHEIGDEYFLEKHQGAFGGAFYLP